MNLIWLRRLRLPILFLFTTLVFTQGLLHAQTPPAAPGNGSPAATPAPWKLAVNLEGAEKPGEISVGLQIVVVMTLLSLAPTLVMLMTSFTRIVVVLGFLRTAIGLPNAPSNQIITGLALFLTLFVMGPTLTRIEGDAVRPYLDDTIDGQTAWLRGSSALHDFMIRQTRKTDIAVFARMANVKQIETPADTPMRVLIPAYVISELKTAFIMGFCLYIPFILIDLVVSVILMSLGMMMMPPMVISTPFKILLFILVDGWQLIARVLSMSFH